MASAIAGKKRDMTQGSEWKALILFALPIMAGQVLQQLYNTVDGIVVGNYVSSEALAAVGTCGSLANFFVYMSTGLSNGCGIVISQFFGAKRREEMRKAVSSSIVMLTALGVVLAVLACIFTPWIMKSILGVKDPVIYDMAVVYFRIYAVGLIFKFSYNIVASVMRAVGDSKSTLYFLLVATVGNAALDLFFVRCFNMGVAGVAIATVLAQFACVAVSVVYMYKKHPDLRFGRGEWKIDGEMSRICMKMAVPSSLQQIVSATGNIILQRLVNSFGAVTMSAFTVGTRIDTFLSVANIGIYNALSSFVGQNTGANKPERVKRGFKAGMCMSIGVAAVMSSILYLLAPHFAGFFGVEGEVLAQSVEFIRFYSSFFLMYAIYMPFNGLFQGAGVPMAAASATMINLGVRVGSSYAMALIFSVGYSSVWKGNVFGWTAAILFVLTYYFTGSWRTKRLVKD